MSEEYSRKRQREGDFEDDYEPQQQQQSLPPHLMGANAGDNGSYDDYAPAPPHATSTNEHQHPPGGRFNEHHDGNNAGRYEGGYRKRQRRLQMSVEIQRANELCDSLQTFGDSAYNTKVLLAQSTETMSYFWSDPDFSSSVLKFLGATIVETPHKSVLFSGLIMLANSKNEQIGKDLIGWLRDRIIDVFTSMEPSNDMDVDIDAGGEQMSFSKSWSRIIMIIRMLGLLVDIIEDFDVVVKMIQQLLEFAVELQNSKTERCGLAELIYYELTISIPYLIINSSNNSELKDKCKELLAISKNFNVKDFSELESGLYNPIAIGSVKFCDVLKNAPAATEEYLDDMSLFYDTLSSVKPLIKTVLDEKAMRSAKTGEDAENEGASPENIVVVDDAEEKKMSKHSIGEISVPSFEVLSQYENLNEYVSTSDALWKKPRFFIELFPNEQSRKDLEFETSPKLATYVSMILNDLIISALTNLEYNRVTLSKQFLNFQRFFNEKKFAKSNSPLDKLMIINDLNKGLDFDLVKNLEDSTDFDDSIKNQMISSAKKIQTEFESGYTSTWKMEEVVLENIINFIFLIPESEKLPLVFFESLLTDTCGRDWTLVKRSQLHSNESLMFSKLIGDCFRYFYDNIEQLKYENIVKFINWFVFQISNFKFQWEWQEWITDVIQLGEENIYNPKIFFIKNVIHKEILLTNFKYIRDRTLPDDLKKFANLSLKNKEGLIEYDSKFFGNEFAQSNTSNPFEEIEEGNIDAENEEPQPVVETNTDTYKLFSHYLFNHDDHPYNDICRDIYMNLENVDESAESLIELTNKLKERIENDGDGIVNDSEEYIITLVVQSICLIGSRSFSVFEESLNKVFGFKLNAIIENTNNEAKEQWIINAVLRIWNSEPRIGFMFIEKLYRYGSITEESVIISVWNCTSDKILPLSEIYADEFLDRILDYADEEDGEEEMAKQKKMIGLYLSNGITRLNELTKEVETSNEKLLDYLDGLKDDNLDIEWGVKNLIGLLISKIMKFKAKYDKEDFGFSELFESIENEEVKNHFNKIVYSV